MVPGATLLCDKRKKTKGSGEKNEIEKRRDGRGKKMRYKLPQAPYCQEVCVLEMSAQAMEASFRCVFPGFGQGF